MNFSEKNGKLSVVSLNVRFANPDDGAHVWQNRKKALADMIRFWEPDILGLQEVLEGQLADLGYRLPEYHTMGVGREDGFRKGEYCAILFRKERFKLVAYNNFWLSEQPDQIGSKGWDAACERVVTWARLLDKTTGKEFFVFNTHFDHVGQVARRESVNLLLERIDKIAGNIPVILTGDFNATPDSPVIRSLTNPDDYRAMINSREIAPFRAGPAWTFHDFDRLPVSHRSLIDYIFIKNSLQVTKFGVIPTNNDSICLSDHNAVAATLAF